MNILPKAVQLSSYSVSISLPAVVVRSLLLDTARGNVCKDSYSAFILQLRGRYLQCYGINLFPSCFVLPGQDLATSTEERHNLF